MAERTFVTMSVHSSDQAADLGGQRQRGEAEYIPFKHQSQLTTGHTPFCPVTWGEWCDGASGCPRLHDDRPMPAPRFGRAPACMCRYDLHYVPDAPGPRYPIDPFGRFTRKWGVWSFRIHPKCPHHGDNR